MPYPTGVVQVTLDDAGVPCYEIKENVAWDNIPFTPQLEELARHTRAVCFGSLAQRSIVSRETINRFLSTMSEKKGQYKIFDINLRQGFYTKEMLILTCGVNGSYVFTANEMSFVETPRVEVADTVGAGDSFTAAFIAAILAGKCVAEAHQLAVNVSAYVCTQNGAMPVLPKEMRTL